MKLIHTVLASLCLYAVVPRLVARAADEAEGPKALLKLGSAIEDRNVVETTSFAVGETAYAWTQVQGIADGAVLHVWLRNGVEIARHDLDVKSARRWRTWSRARLLPGTYTVRVLTRDGATLGETQFEVLPASADEQGC